LHGVVGLQNRRLRVRFPHGGDAPMTRSRAMNGVICATTCTTLGRHHATEAPASRLSSLATMQSVQFRPAVSFHLPLGWPAPPDETRSVMQVTTYIRRRGFF